MPHYVTVPAQTIEEFLARKGFARTVQRHEVVYVRASRRNPDVKIKVYTSIRTGNQAARGKGKDSIKVAAVFDNGRRSFGIGKFPRVHRTGSPEAVLERVQDRLLKAAERANQWIDQNDSAWRERLKEKAEFARLEREQEEAAFAAGP